MGAAGRTRYDIRERRRRAVGLRPVRHPGDTGQDRALHSGRRLPGVELIVLPEALLGGYPRGPDFGVTVGPSARKSVSWGAAICWENHMPLFRQAMYAKGVQIWCAPTVDDRDQCHATVQHIVLEGRCFVLSAGQFLARTDLPEDVHPVRGADPGAVLINGGSTIVSPLGEVLAGPLRGSEGVLVAELDLDDLIRVRFDLDTAGHYARPDVFTMRFYGPAAPRTDLPRLRSTLGDVLGGHLHGIPSGS